MNLKTYLLENPEILGKLISRSMTNKEFSEQSGYSPVYISQILKELDVKKIKGQVVSQREKRSMLRCARSDFRADLAQKVAEGIITIEQAAREARCSERTIYRFLNKVKPNAK